MAKKYDKNRVYFGAPGIEWTYFLIEVYSVGAGHVGCYLVEQAHAGPLTGKIENHLWNQVNAQLEKNRLSTGLGYRIRAAGDRGFCIQRARKMGWNDV